MSKYHHIDDGLRDLKRLIAQHRRKPRPPTMPVRLESIALKMAKIIQTFAGEKVDWRDLVAILAWRNGKGFHHNPKIPEQGILRALAMLLGASPQRASEAAKIVNAMEGYAVHDLSAAIQWFGGVDRIANARLRTKNAAPKAQNKKAAKEQRDKHRRELAESIEAELLRRKRR